MVFGARVRNLVFEDLKLLSRFCQGFVKVLSRFCQGMRKVRFNDVKNV